MAEAFVQVILDNLSSLIKEEIGVILHVDEEMKKLCSTLTTIQAVLEDGEDKHIENPPIRNWLRKLNALAYEIDDILDDCNTHVSKSKHFATTLSRYSIKKIMYRHNIGRRMKEVTQKLDSVAAERAKFHLREISVDKPREAAAWRETGSMLNDCDFIYGRDADRDEIVKVLVEDVREKSELSVLPVIGVGGLGKTTLAQLVFNDPRVVEHFEKRVWICVSDNFEIKTLVKAMIESATGSGRADLQHLDALQRCLWEVLSQKRYLVVLDDVWNDDQHKWFELKDILSCGSSGASIIVTTRLKKVADIMGTLPAHCLKGISDEHCWMLFHGADIVTRLTVAIEKADSRCFPIDTLVKFTNLEELTIRGANEISVVGDGLQALKQLKYLKIGNCGRMRCIPEGLFRQLSSLQTLLIDECPELVELPEEEIKHLKNLEKLYLYHLRKMSRLPQALQNLSSLNSLNVFDCPEVVSIPAAIPNLKQLRVGGCPQLERRCRKETGEDWHKIAHIPHLFIRD